MADNDIKAILMKIVDGIATPEEHSAFEEAARNDPGLKDELTAFRKIKEVTDSMQFKELPDSYWDGYWTSVYRRVERSVGWVFFSIGAIIVIVFCLYLFLSEFLTDPSISLVLRIGVVFGGFGAVVLIVSAIRERFFARKHERYEREVER